MPTLMENPPHLSSSPAKSSPRRRKISPVKKGISFTPKKKSPAKGLKRGVRWRDENEDGALAEFQATPKRIESTPEVSSEEPAPPTLPPGLSTEDSENSSPIPPPPEASLDLKPRSNRFQTGFLSKKAGSSPKPFNPNRSSTLSSAMNTHDAVTCSGFASDSDHSPLREIEPNKAPYHRQSSSLNVVHTASSSELTSGHSGAWGSESDSDRGPTKSSKHKPDFPLDPSESRKIRSALNTAAKRSSTSGGALVSNSVSRAHRRRSPTGSSSGSPPSENMFSASHARRMVRSSDRGAFDSVLSPRTAPVNKHGAVRRMTTHDFGGRSGSGSGDERTSARATPARMSSSEAAGFGGHLRQTSRGSLMGGTKSAWR